MHEIPQRKMERHSQLSALIQQGSQAIPAVTV